MMTDTLPRCAPFRTMLECLTDDGIDLITTVDHLVQCRAAERMLIDVLADDVEDLQGHGFRFTYSFASWKKLCNAIGEMQPANDVNAAAPSPVGMLRRGFHPPFVLPDEPMGVSEECP